MTVHNPPRTALVPAAPPSLAPPGFDAVFAAAAMLTGLFPLQLSTMTGVIFLALPALYLFFRRDRMWPLLRANLLLLLIPGFALLSTLWSPLPGVTSWYATQFLVTVTVAMMIGTGVSPSSALIGLFAAFVIHGLATYVRGIIEGALIGMPSYVVPYVGFAGSKNTCADMAGLGVMTALAMVGWSLERRRWLLALAAMAMILLDVHVVASARSAGANASLAIATLFMLGWLVLRQFPVQARTSFALIATLAAGIAGATRGLWYDAVFSDALKAAGKDEQLTGRTYLWERAEVLIHQNPILGRGFASFWRFGELEPEAIWEAMYVKNRMGFNFHNSIYEILVYLGYTGLILFAIVYIILIAALFIRLVLRPKPITIMFATLIIYDMIRFNFESLPLGIFAHNTLYLYGALAHGAGLFLQPARDAAAAAQPKRLSRRATRAGARLT